MGRPHRRGGRGCPDHHLQLRADDPGRRRDDREPAAAVNWIGARAHDFLIGDTLSEEDGIAFGGKQLTTTDIAIASGVLSLGDKSKVAHLDAATCKKVFDEAARLSEEADRKSVV